MEQPRNPFILGHKISRPYFCDREAEQRKLVDSVINGRNVVLISPRRMGKTSLVHVAINETEELREEYLTFFFDILQTNTLSEFTYLLGKAILPTFDIQIGDIKNPEYVLEEIFEYLQKSEKPVLIVIDEFQQITKYPEKNSEALLRTYMQRLENVCFVFAGSERTVLQDMFASSNRPFYNSSEIMHLEAIPEQIYVEFARKQFIERRRGIQMEAISWAYKLFEGNTFYLQRTMNGAFAKTPEHSNCLIEDVKETVREMLASNEVIYREMLSNMSQSQKATLIAMARERRVASPTSGAFIKKHSLASASSVQSALRKLLKSGTVTKGFAGYQITDPLFRIFINSLYSIPEI